MFRQILLTYYLTNVTTTERRICIFTSGLEGLNTLFAAAQTVYIDKLRFTWKNLKSINHAVLNSRLLYFALWLILKTLFIFSINYK